MLPWSSVAGTALGTFSTSLAVDGHGQQLVQVALRGRLDADQPAFEVADVLGFVDRSKRSSSGGLFMIGTLVVGVRSTLFAEVIEPGGERMDAARPRPQIEVTSITLGELDGRLPRWSPAAAHRSSCSSPGEVDQLLAAEPAGHALAARLLLEELQQLTGVVQHRELLARLRAVDDDAGPRVRSRARNSASTSSGRSSTEMRSAGQGLRKRLHAGPLAGLALGQAGDAAVERPCA